MSSPVTAHLILITGDDSSFQPTIELNNQNRVIGRAQNCDIIWGSLQISRKHASLEYMVPKWYIRDTSTNGLSVNGMKLTKGELFPLKDADIISFIPTGAVRYRFRYVHPTSPQRGAPLARLAPQQGSTISPQPSTSSASTSRVPAADLANNNTANGRRSVEVIDSDSSSNHSESILSVDAPDDFYSFTGGLSPPQVESDGASSPAQNMASNRKHKAQSSSDSESNQSEQKKKKKRVQIASSDEDSDSKCSHDNVATLRLNKKSKLLTETEIDNCNDMEKLKGHLRDAMLKLKTTEVKLTAEKIQREMDLEETRKKQQDVSSANEAFKEETYKKILEVMESELSCSICNEVFIQATVVDCGHTFCHFCIGEWAKKKPECPICRKGFRVRHRHIEMENYITKIFESFTAEISAKRKISIKEREEQEKKVAEEEAQARANPRAGGNNFHAIFQNTAERYVDFLAELHQINEILGPQRGRGARSVADERRRSARIQDRVIEAVAAGAGGGAPRARRGRNVRNATAAAAAAAAAAAVSHIGVVQPPVRASGRNAAANAQAPPPNNVPVVTLNDTAEENATPPPPQVARVQNQFMNYVRRIPNLLIDINRGDPAT